VAEERKYREDEISEIFALATTAGGASLPALADQEGLTLGELQEVGREVGIAPERVAAAAATLDVRSETLPRRTLLGAPVSVGRVVELPRAATDREWQFLVAELRETFDAKGEVTSHGDIREWTNGNLYAVLEQTEAGHLLRLGTRKGNAMEVAGSGFAGLMMGLFILAVLAMKGGTGAEFLIPVLFLLAGGGALASNFLRLPRWAAERERQMEHIAGRARALLEAPLPENVDYH
jgi:hypothetical protein